MSNIAALFNIPGDADSLGWFSFQNAASHAGIAAAVKTQLAVVLVQYPLDPMPLGEALGGWLYNHQSMHDQQNAVLGIAGNDLTTFDIKDRSQVVNWIQLHAEEHRQAESLLGL